MADDDRYLTGEGEIDRERRSAGYGTNTSFGPFSMGAILGGQEDAIPSVGGRFTAQLPEGLSATLVRTGQAGSPMADAVNAVTLAKQLEAGQLGLTASRAGERGPPSYSAQYSHPIGAPTKGGKPAGNWYVEAGMTPGTPERHVRGGAKFNFADGGHVDAALHLLRHHLAGGGFLSDLFSGPDYLSTGEVASPTNWGDPESAADFFKADRALRLAREASEPARDTPLPLRRPVAEAAPRQQVAAPAPAPAARRIETLPGDTVEPHYFPPALERTIGPYDFGQQLTGRQFRESPPHLAETPGFGQSMLDGYKYADQQPEVPTSQLQKYTLPEAAFALPAPQAEISRAVSLAQNLAPAQQEPIAFDQALVPQIAAAYGPIGSFDQALIPQVASAYGPIPANRPDAQAETDRVVSLARETIPSAADALAAVEKLHNSGVYSGEALDKAGEILQAHNLAQRDNIPVDEALRLIRAEGPRMVNQGMPVTGGTTRDIVPLSYAAAPTPAPAAQAITEAMPATGKMTARIPEEPHGTALTKQQADYVIRTIAAETSGKSPEETQAIASVILNRINSGKYGSSPEAVLFAKRQFEPWMNPAGANYPMKISPTSQRYLDARAALEAAMAGEDITRGATNFWGPKSQYSLGRDTPDWAVKMPDYTDIGATRFHRPNKRAEGGSVDDALHVVRERHADGERVGMDDPRQWLQFGGQDMERAPAGLPIGQAAGTSLGYNTVEGLADATKLANQVMAGEVDPVSDEGIQRALGAAMAAQTGGLGGVSARAGETVLGAGPVRKAAQDELSGLFDYSRLHEVPKVPQFELPRNIPPRGVPERVTDVAADPNLRGQMMDIIEQGQRAGGPNWYNTDPLRDKFVEQLGADAGDKAHRKYMDFVAATSPRSKVGENIRNASYYYGREMRGEGMPEVGERNPQPFGHYAQRNHQINANAVAGAGWEPLKNPKVSSFVENLVGNQLPATVDTHALRLPAMLARDPRFLETAYQASKDAPKLNIQKLVQSGDMSMEDALKTASYWQAYPKPNEYAALEQYYKSLAKEMGMTPAQTQASAWIGGGKLTGLASDESKPFLRFFDDRIMKTARETGMDPKDVLRDFISGKAPLYAKGGSVEDRALMLVSKQA